MMLVLPTCYLNLLNMIHRRPFLSIQNPSRIVEVQDLRCNHGSIGDRQPYESVEFKLDGIGDF
jgi:hypothetical protein